jgi:sulfide:quinone oxidoreductase
MLRTIAPDYAVAGQLQPNDMSEIAGAGYKAVINNRPDGEDPAQPSAAVMEAAARAAGLQYRYIPVGAAHPVEKAAVALKAALAELPRPIVGYCRSGARSTTVYQLANDQD